ncbi:MAG: 2-amino-4-hydroxy-6-hydroxymethyldihydropteridine pyrophosphokinase [bacterium]|nr:MAG: 2-amino-4-hydroxy-6-hydroxymethyldihydropteridine pyrophosphokinase [bacterium]
MMPIDRSNMKIIYFGLGSNRGDRYGYLQQAKTLLSQYFELTNQSSIYETAPIGYIDQGAFLNQAVEMETSESTDLILLKTQGIESKLDKETLIKWGPRTIDIDILLYGEDVVDEPYIKIPHPQMIHRRFVLEPLYEIDHNLKVPPYHKSIGHYLKNVQDQDVQIYTLNHSCTRLNNL